MKALKHLLPLANTLLGLRRTSAHISHIYVTANNKARGGEGGGEGGGDISLLLVEYGFRVNTRNPCH